MFLLMAAPLAAQTVTKPFTADITDDSASVTCTWSKVVGDPTDALAATTKTLTGSGTSWTQTFSTVGTFSVAGPRKYMLTCTDGTNSPSATVDFNVTINKAPTIKITSPVNGSTIAFNLSAPINATATNSIRTSVSVDGTTACTTASNELDCGWRPGPQRRGKTVQMKFSALSATGESAESAIAVKVR